MNVSCAKCNHELNQAPKQSFLGFKTVTCPECQETLTYSLTTKRIIVYWVIVIWMTFQIYITFSENLTKNFAYNFGQFIVPGLLLFPAITALLKNVGVRKNTSKVK